VNPVNQTLSSFISVQQFVYRCHVITAVVVIGSIK